MNFVRLLLLLLLLFSALFSEELIDRQIEQQALKKYGPFAKNRFIDLQNSLLHTLKHAPINEQLNHVNSWVNTLHYASDKELYGVRDYWATLYEFVARGKGDCEDYTIAKYFILKALGVDPHRMKFAYVIYKNRRGKKIAHMVLLYFKVKHPKSRDDILILDNNNRLVLPASKRPDLVKMIKMINGDTGAKSKKWKELEVNMKRKKI